MGKIPKVLMMNFSPIPQGTIHQDEKKEEPLKLLPHELDHDDPPIIPQEVKVDMAAQVGTGVYGDSHL